MENKKAKREVAKEPLPHTIASEAPNAAPAPMPKV